MPLEYHEMIELFDIRGNFLQSTATAVEAVKVLERVVGKIILVVDSDERVIGTITDGDIRRHLLSKNNLDCTVWDLMNKNPVLLHEDYDFEEILETHVATQRCLDFPIVDQNGQATSMLSYQRLPNRVRETPIVLMAGGRGTRLGDLTQNMPKPMLKVAGIPIIEGTIKRLRAQGFHQFIISVNYLAEKIKDHFGSGEKLNVSITYLEEEKPLGTAGCLWLARNQLDRNFILMNGDIITNTNFDNMLRYHQFNNASLTMAVRNYTFDVPYGVVDISEEEKDIHRIVGISEKPQFKFFVNTGMYILSPSVLSEIPDNTFFDMTTLCNALWEKNKFVASFPINEYWVDVGKISELQKASSEYHTIFGPESE